MNYLFTNVTEACALRQQRNETVHLTVNLDAFDHFIAIGFQAAVEVMQLDP